MAQQVIIRRKRLLTAPDLAQLVLETSTKKPRADPQGKPGSGGRATFVPYRAGSEEQQELEELAYWEGVVAAESAGAAETTRRIFRLAGTQRQQDPLGPLPGVDALGVSPTLLGAGGSSLASGGNRTSPADAASCLQGSRSVEFRGYQRKAHGTAIFIDIEDEESDRVLQDEKAPDYVYDFYVLDQKADPNCIDIHALVRVEDRVDDLIFGSDEDTNSNDSEDSNAEGYFVNEYPDEDEIQSWEERTDEDGSGTENDSDDADSSDEEDEDDYMHGYDESRGVANLRRQLRTVARFGKTFSERETDCGDDGDEDDEADEY